jgi:hypothetical protein
MGRIKKWTSVVGVNIILPAILISSGAQNSKTEREVQLSSLKTSTSLERAFHHARPWLLVPTVAPSSSQNSLPRGHHHLPCSVENKNHTKESGAGDQLQRVHMTF